MNHFSDPLYRHELRDRLAHAYEYVAEDIRDHLAAGGLPRGFRFKIQREVGQALRRIEAAQSTLEEIEAHFSSPEAPAPASGVPSGETS